MIKILFFIENLEGGGAEKVLRDLVNHMDQTKFAITVQTIWPFDASKLLVPGIRYKTTYRAKNKVNQLRYRVEAELGILYWLHVRDNYDIECAYLEMGPTKVMAASTNKKAKKLAWVHCDLSKAVSNDSAYEETCAPWYRKYDRVICVSETVKHSFDQIFHSAFHSEVLYNVIDDEAIRRKAKEPIPGLTNRKLTMLAVGTMYPPKNYPRLLRTHLRLLQEGFDIELWILGEGEQRTQIEQFIKDQHLEKSVRLFGFQTNPYPYFSHADLIVCSSNYEGFSTVITESVILGKAVVTTDCSGMREILGDSEYGMITENNDESFLRGVRKIISDRQLRENYENRAFQRGFAFSMNDLVGRTEDYFRKVAGE